MDAPSPSSASHGWRSILIGRNLLQIGLGWSIGDGHKARVWHDPWLSVQHPQILIGPTQLHQAAMLVKDLLYPTLNQWDTAAIRQHLPQYEDAIKAIIPSLTHLQDSLVWLPEKLGLYTSKSGYHIARNAPIKTSIAPNAFNWNKCIWQVKASPKVRHFLWKATGGVLSLGSNLAKRGLRSTLCCKRCGAVEDELHLFFTCPFAKKVWELSPLQPHISAGTFQNFKCFLSRILTLKALPPTGLSLSPLAPWLLWNLWKARNYLIFEDHSLSNEDTINKAIREAKEWQAAQLMILPQSKHQLPPPPRQPIAGSTKCFVDAAWCATTRVCGQGWIFYDPAGNAPMRFSASRPFVNSSLTAEALALRSALLSLKQNPILNNTLDLEMFSDSQALISSLKSKASSKEHKAILHDITNLSESFSSVAFNFVPRLDNIVADSIAKTALRAANSISFDV